MSDSTLDRWPDLPRQMQKLHFDKRGFPVPWFVAWENGEPLFPVANAGKLSIAVNRALCWVCGGKLPKMRASVIGPMCAITGTISEPQSHIECCRFSARHCPFLANPRMKRMPEAKLPVEKVAPGGVGIKRNPGACAIWIESQPSKPFESGTGVLFALGKPSKVEWYAQGREATRAEIMESITSGIHLLTEACDQEPTPQRRLEALKELKSRYQKTLTLLPAA